MTGILIAWALTAAALLVLGGFLGLVIRRSVLGILIDSRGRYSLTHFQVVLWTIVLVSLIGAVALGRVFAGASNPLQFSIPNELLIVMGISLGSATSATAIKAFKDETRPAAVAASGSSDPPRLEQIFLLEEGAMADKVIDMTKFQQFAFTTIFVLGYVVMTIGFVFNTAPKNLTALPSFSQTMLTLLGISHAGYIGGKLPNRAGDPQGLSVDDVFANPAAPVPAGTPPRRLPRARLRTSVV